MSDEDKVPSAGYGYFLGPRAFGIEIVRRARKEFACEGSLVDSDFVDVQKVSPASGSVVNEGHGPSCSPTIRPGDLYVAADHAGEYVVEMKGTYRYTWRTCVPCAIASQIIEPSA